MKHGSLFSGIGGFDLAAQWMGWENVFHCEKNDFGRKVLNHYWPESISYEDVTQTDFTIHAGAIDILTGGFPCQPYSTAGKRLGKEDDRHLWPEMLRAIREIKPGYVVGENVRGLLNWSGGLVFDEVQADLEAEGYEVIPFLLPACAVNAPHRRDRIWFVAYAGHSQPQRRESFKEGQQPRGRREAWSKLTPFSLPEITTYAKGQQDNGRRQGGLYTEPAGVDAERVASNANSQRFKKRTPFGNASDKKEDGAGVDNSAKRQGDTRNAPNSTSCGWIQDDKEQCTEQPTQGVPDWRSFPTQPPVCGGDDGLPAELDGITVSRHRRESIKAYGNAIVPQVAYQIFQAIEETNFQIQ